MTTLSERYERFRTAIASGRVPSVRTRDPEPEPRSCTVCGVDIDRHRRRLFPRAVTCSAPCSLRHGEREQRRRSRDYQRSRRAALKTMRTGEHR